MDAHAAAKSEYRPLGDAEGKFVGDFVPLIGDGVRPVSIELRGNTSSRGPQARRQKRLVLLNAQWRGGSTLAEQLIFSTTIAPPFLLDEPAKAMWLDSNNHKPATYAPPIHARARCTRAQHTAKRVHARGKQRCVVVPEEKIHHSVASSCVCRVNFDALRCDFSKFNHTLLLSWQHWRGEFTRQRKLLNYRTFEELRRRCFTAGNVRRGRKRSSIVCPSEPTPLSANLNQPHRRNGSHVCVSATHVRCLHVLS